MRAPNFVSSFIISAQARINKEEIEFKARNPHSEIRNLTSPHSAIVGMALRDYL